MPAAASAAERRLVFVVDYRLFARDLGAWLGEHDYAVEWLVPSALSVELFCNACRVLRPAFVASINFSPEIALLCTLAKTPYLSWTVDPLGPERFALYPGTDIAWLLAFAHRRETVARLRGLGLTDSEYLPLAASPRREARLDAPALEAYRANSSFVGSSLSEEAGALPEGLRAHGAEPGLLRELAAFVERALDAHEGDVGYAGVPADASGLRDALGTELPAGVEPAQLADWLNGALSHRLRMRRVDALAPLGVRVYGDAGWRASAGRYAGVADHGDELTKIYAASRLNLDVPRIYQRDIVTMRVFDIMACGGVVLSEPSPDLLELFSDGTELVCYASGRELREKAAWLLASEAERAAIGEAARAAVARAHRLAHRFERLAQGLARRGFAQLTR